MFKLTDKARALLRGPIVVNDCSAKCTCGECVMRRLRKSGKLARWARSGSTRVRTVDRSRGFFVVKLDRMSRAVRDLGAKR